MTNWQRFRVIAEYPGNLLFSVTWAWANRRASKKPFITRMLDAAEDAMEVF